MAGGVDSNQTSNFTLLHDTATVSFCVMTCYLSVVFNFCFG